MGSCFSVELLKAKKVIDDFKEIRKELYNYEYELKDVINSLGNDSYSKVKGNLSINAGNIEGEANRLNDMIVACDNVISLYRSTELKLCGVELSFTEFVDELIEKTKEQFTIDWKKKDKSDDDKSIRDYIRSAKDVTPLLIDSFLEDAKRKADDNPMKRGVDKYGGILKQAGIMWYEDAKLRAELDPDDSEMTWYEDWYTTVDSIVGLPRWPDSLATYFEFKADMALYMSYPGYLFVKPEDKAFLKQTILGRFYRQEYSNYPEGEASGWATWALGLIEPELQPVFTVRDLSADTMWLGYDIYNENEDMIMQDNINLRTDTANAIIGKVVEKVFPNTIIEDAIGAPMFSADKVYNKLAEALSTHGTNSTYFKDNLVQPFADALKNNWSELHSDQDVVRCLTDIKSESGELSPISQYIIDKIEQANAINN